MSTAILTGQPVPGSSIEADLRSLGFDVRTAADTTEAETLLAAVPGDRRVAVVDARFVGHLHALRLGLTDPRFPLAAVPGAVTAQPGGRQALTRAVAREHSAGGGTALLDDLADRVVTALDADGCDVHRPELGSLVATVPTDPQARNEARQAVAAVDDEAVRLKSAVKSRDGFFTTHFISPYSRYIARWCARRGLTPNQVTTASLLTALIAAACAATGTRPGFVAAGVLLIASFVLDCVDGQIARYALKYSTLGAWLDATFDRAKESLLRGPRAGRGPGRRRRVGARARRDDPADLPARRGLLVQRGQPRRHRQHQPHRRPLRQARQRRLDGLGAPDDSPAHRRTMGDDRRPHGRDDPRITFYVLLVGCAFAATYTTAGRVLRSLTRKARRTDRAAQALADLADNGPLASFVARVNPGRLGAPLLLALVGTAVLVASLFSGVTWAPVAGALVYAVAAGQALSRPLKGTLDWLVPRSSAPPSTAPC